MPKPTLLLRGGWERERSPGDSELGRQFRDWCLRTYGDSAKTKTVTRSKYQGRGCRPRGVGSRERGGRAAHLRGALITAPPPLRPPAAHLRPLPPPAGPEPGGRAEGGAPGPDSRRGSLGSHRGPEVDGAVTAIPRMSELRFREVQNFPKATPPAWQAEFGYCLYTPPL
ncbi:TPA: hypothetical protein BOS_13591 [Bos taurus]|nr:TPA: hypothetical protein BOS_13591 [Bos taurus]